MTKEKLKELEKQRNELDKQIKEYYENNHLELLKEHRKLVGKCFKTNYIDGEQYTVYYRVIHEESYTDNYVEALNFITPLQYSHFPMRMHGDSYSTECYIFDFDRVEVKEFKEMIEITEEEFNIAMDNCLKELKGIIDKQIKERKELDT